MLRIVPFTRSLEAGARIAERIDFTYALFVLVIEFVAPAGGFVPIMDKLAPSRGYYRIRAQVHFRSQSVLDLIHRHKLQNTELFHDLKAKKEAQKRLELATERLNEASLESTVILWPLLIGGQVLAEQRLAKIVCLTLNNLKNGIEIAGTMDEIKVCQGALCGAVDKTHARLLYALGFDQGDLIIVAPGTPPKKGKDKKKGRPRSS